MSKFKDRLWQELVREYGSELAEVTEATRKHGRLLHPKLLAGTTAGVVGVGTAAALVISAAGSSPAFAVSRNSDGTVSVTIKEVSGISGANARLAQIGVPVRAVEVAQSCAAGPPPRALRKVLGGLPRAEAFRVGRGPVHVTVTARFDPRGIPPGRTLVLPAFRMGQKLAIVRGPAVRGAAPPCLPFPPPPWPAPGHGKGGVCQPVSVPPGGAHGRPPPLPPLPPPPPVEDRSSGRTEKIVTNGPLRAFGPPRLIQCRVGPPHEVHPG